MTIVERLMARRFIDPETGCWILTGATNPAGYASINWNGRKWFVHRLETEGMRFAKLVESELLAVRGPGVQLVDVSA
jgi:hypothetical protein